MVREKLPEVHSISPIAATLTFRSDAALGNDDPADSMMLHVRASNEIVVPIIALCESEEWSALDCGTGELLEHADDPAKGLESWRAFRDRVTGQ